MPGSPVRATSLRLPLADESVDLIVTSPPYWGLRSYRDGDEHYQGQVGDEATPREFLEALWSVLRECWRVLKPEGSVFVNLGDKRAGSGGHNNAGLPGRTIPAPAGMELDEKGNGRPARDYTGIEIGRTEADPNAPARRGRGARAIRAPRVKSTRRNAPDNYNRSGAAGDHEVRAKSKLLLPHRFAIGCEDGRADPCVLHPDLEPDHWEPGCRGIGWVLRQDLVWEKPNGMPESTPDRTRDGHEYWFHLTKEGSYYANLDAIREPHDWPLEEYREDGAARHTPEFDGERIDRQPWGSNPLGRQPSSVWRIPTAPLLIPDEVIERRQLPRHFAAFPQEWPRRLVQAFTPEGICVECGAGRRPIYRRDVTFDKARDQAHAADIAARGAAHDVMSGGTEKSTLNARTSRTYMGDACDCTPTGPDGAPDFDGWAPPATRPAVVVDPFGGTGTTAGVADALGRVGVSVDLSFDYSRLAAWRLRESGHFARTVTAMWAERQEAMF